MRLGTKQRQQQTAGVFKQHLRDKLKDKWVLVEEFVHDVEGSGKERHIAKWGRFTGASQIQHEMLRRLDAHFDQCAES